MDVRGLWMIRSVLIRRQVKGNLKPQIYPLLI
jgi:hypothetical protein